MKLFGKLLRYVSGILVLLLLSIHLLLTFKAKELLQTVVHNVSHGQYRFEATMVAFRYMRPGIQASGLRLIPIGQGKRQASISMASADIQLSSLWHLVFQKKVEVDHIQISHLSIEAFAQNKSGVKKQGIAETIQHIQDNLLTTIASLNIKNLSLYETELKLHTADSSHQGFLYLNHLHLQLNDIQLAKAKQNGTPLFSMKGSLTLKQPNIHLPDSKVLVGMGELKVTIADSSMAIDSLALTINPLNNAPQKVLLSSLDIAGFHWHHFLSEGILEFDSLIAEQGKADINLLLSKSKTQSLQKSKMYEGPSIVVHHVLVSDIDYRLKSINRNAAKPLPINMQLEGDSLLLTELTIAHKRQPAFDVKQLSIIIRNFEEQDSLKNQQIKFSKVDIDEKQLVINNYLIETNKEDAKRNYLRISIPQFQLNNFSLEDLMQKHLVASSMAMIQPNIVVDIRQVQHKENKPKSHLNERIAGIMQNASQKIKLGEIGIKDGNFILLPTLDPKDQIKLTGLSMIIDASKLPKINSAMDVVHAIKSLSTSSFTIVGKNLKLDVKNMQLLNNPRGLYFGTISGQLASGKKIHLKGVTLLNSHNNFDPTKTNGLHLSDLKVDSGTISIVSGKNLAPNKKNDPNQPVVHIDNLDLGSLIVTLDVEGRIGASTALSVKAKNVDLENQHIYWSSLRVMTQKPGLVVDKTTFDAASMDLTQPGQLSIHAPQGKTSFGSGQLAFKAQSLVIMVGISNTDVSKLQIEAIKIVKPLLQLTLQKRMFAYAPIHNQNKPNKDILLEQLELEEPTIEFLQSDSGGAPLQKHQAYSGTFLLKQLRTVDQNNQPLFAASHISYQTTSPKSDIKGRLLHPSALGFAASNFTLHPASKQFSFKVDSAYIHQISQTIVGKKSDTLQVSVSQLGLKNFPFNSKDSIDLPSLLSSAQWAASGIQLGYYTPEKTIEVRNAQAKNDNNNISLSLDSFAILPRQNRYEAWAKSAYEKGYETITGGKISATGIQVAFHNKKPAISLNKLHTSHLHFTTAKDKTKLEDTLDYRPLLTQTLLKIPIPLFIDSVLLSNAYVQANEISKKTKKETTIFFTEANGYIKNVKTSNIQPLDTLDMRIRARFYGTDVVRLHFRQSYYDSLQEFWMRVRMSHFEMPEMNRLLVPLMGLKIHTGTVDSLLLVAKGNDYFAYGTMDLRFHNLKVKLLKTEDTKGKFFIGIANFATSVFLRKHDNSRTNLLYKERIRKRSIFNFWGKIALEGLLTNLGIKSDKKERRKFKKSLEALNLPDKYWQDEDND